MLHGRRWALQNEFMRSRGLPRPLRKRIRKYYTTFWSRGVYFSESDIVGELSFNIRRELAHFMNEVSHTRPPLRRMHLRLRGVWL